MVEINKKLLPIKAHWFCFMATMGPIFPQLSVFGKQLGVSAEVNGYITCLLPVLFMIAKPAVGCLADFFSNQRKAIFMFIILFASVSYTGFYFIPQPSSTNAHSLDSNISSNITNGNVKFSYNSFSFFMFLICLCLGAILFNVANSISDAICFDILGEEDATKYGNQRVWGTIGFGVTALTSGIVVHIYSDSARKSITPALCVMLLFCILDLLAATKLKLPKFTSTGSIHHNVKNLLKNCQILLFLLFATLAGVIESFITNFLLWYLEDLAIETGFYGSVKLIEGCVIGAECLLSEVVFFIISGRIIQKIGHVHCFSLCLFAYALRLGLISIVPNPWYLVLTEALMQGVTFALCYSVIVGYAAEIAPVGASATVQGLVAGMDDGLGYSIGSLMGGQMYKYLGGRWSFRCFSVIALIACISHIILRPSSKKLSTNRNTNADYVLPTEQHIVQIISKTKQQNSDIDKS